MTQFNSSKFLFCIILIGWLLIGCQLGRVSPSSAHDTQPFVTAAALTVRAQQTEITTPGFPTSGPSSLHPGSSTPETFLGPTSLSTATFFPATIASLLGTKCDRFGETVYNQFIESYGDKGCKLPMFSPNEDYLAYVTLERQEDETGIYFVDAVKVLRANGDMQEKEVYGVHKMDYIGNLEWTTTGQLIFWEQIWEGPWVVFVYDPVKDAIVAKMRASEDGALQWNPQHTAFYMTRIGGYGSDNCVGELGGYDFQFGNRFPNLYQVFDIEENDNDPFDIPYGERDNLYVEPFGWDEDGKRLFLTVRPLRWKGDQVYAYEVGPKQAGVLELSSSNVIYKSLAADPSFDYSFEGLPNPKIVSSPYLPKLCPEQ